MSGYPLAIGAGLVLVIGLFSYSYVIEIRKLIKKYSAAFQMDIDKADIDVKSEDFLMILSAIGGFFWIGSIFLIKLPLVEQLAMLPLVISVTVVLGIVYLRFRGAQRIKGFGDQFEMALRMMSGALRVGLGFRQAIILVTDEVPNPARRELLRVIGRANIGINILDALDELSRSVPSSETLMFARVVRVQQQTGGDLAKVLEKLAITIRDRRRVVRKMNALTSQGRMGAMIIGGLPVLVGGFVMLTQADMREAMLHTVPGWFMLGLAVALEAMAAFVLSKILKLDA